MRINISARWVIGITVAVVALLAVACGGDRESSELSGAPPARMDEQTSTDDSFAPGDGDARVPANMPAVDGAPGGVASGEDAAATDGSGYGSSPVLPQMLDRQIIRTATVSVHVDGVSQKFEDVANIALGAGGFVASSTFGNAGETQTASVTIRVPAAEYDATMRRLRDLGEVKEESSNANDVTEQFTDLESRLRNLQASEARYLELLTRAVDINEILMVQDRINATRAEIEQIQGRIQMLENQSALATITAHLLPPPAGAAPDNGGADSPLEVAEEAFEASLAVLLGIATVAIAVAAFSWWLVPLAAGGWFLGRRQLQRRTGV
jgi:hypothetical protein